MVLRTWIVPEPNPALSLSISNIDYRKLDHDDCRWIYSSAMKKYHKEFSELQGFLDYAEILFNREDMKRRKFLVLPPTPPSINIYEELHNTEEIEPNKDKYIKLNTLKSLPYGIIPFIKKYKKKEPHYN